MNVKKIVAMLLSVNVLQFLIGVTIWIVVGSTGLNKINGYVYLSVGLMLISNLITIIGLYFASRYKNDNLEDSIKNLEELNTKLRSQRHDYLNHFQVIYGLMELEEFEEAKKYIQPVFKDILKVSKALKTAQPAVNALLQAKVEAAETNQIDFFLEVRSDLADIPLEPWNLCKILANIIDNGMYALLTKENNRQLNLEIGEDMKHYIFLIYNNGPEIPRNYRNDIFKQGFTTKAIEGHGMGLYIVSKILREVGGVIEMTSNPDKTSFTILIPKKNGT